MKEQRIRKRSSENLLHLGILSKLGQAVRDGITAPCQKFFVFSRTTFFYNVHMVWMGIFGGPSAKVIHQISPLPCQIQLFIDQFPDITITVIQSPKNVILSAATENVFWTSIRYDTVNIVDSTSLQVFLLLLT